jgi:transposase
LPDYEALAKLYLLPPDGEGKSLMEIGSIYGVTDVTAGHWIKEHNLTQDATARLSFHQRNHPKKKIPAPPKTDLESLYLMSPYGKGLSQDQIAEIYQVSRPIVNRWLSGYGMIAPHSERHSARMSGKNNPAFKTGDSTRYLKRQLVEREGAKQCVWCGTTDGIEIHHIDHDRENNNLENLTLLCRYCNMLEAYLWALVQNERANVVISEGEITITFNKPKG